MRQAFLSGCFEVSDESVISPVIHWQGEEKEARNDRKRVSSMGDREQNKQMENLKMTSVNIIRTLICADGTYA